MPTGPLTGVRVVELAGIGPAPFAAMMLAELGAEVLRIERPDAPRLGLPPDRDPLTAGRDMLEVDLKQPTGRDLVLRLLDSADVLVEGFRPGVTERLGLGPDVVLARRPSLVYARMTGWGQDGPLSRTAGHDITYLATTGALHAIGPADAPAVPLNLVGDFGGGALYVVVGVLAALHAVRESGHGQVVDAAVVDGVTHLLSSIYGLMQADCWTDRRADNLLDGAAPYYTVYSTADGGHLAVGALETAFYEEFVRLLAPGEPLPDREDRARWPELRAAIATRIAERPLDEWVAVFAGSDACVAPVLGLADAASHPQIAARGSLRHTEDGLVAGAAPRFSRTPTRRACPARDVAGAPDILRRWGVVDGEQLMAAGVVAPSAADVPAATSPADPARPTGLAYEVHRADHADPVDRADHADREE